jgi:RHS repeat-associated protein
MKVIKEQDTTGSVAYNTYGATLISRDLDGAKVYYLYNGNGDVTGLLSSSGSIIATYYYDAFGNLVEESGNFGNPYRYAGYVYDEQSRLYNLNARFYDAKLARFMQEDTHWNTNNMIYGDHPRYVGNSPVPDNNSMMQSLNLYTYCVNNPLIYTDPTGYKSPSDNVQSAYEAYQRGEMSGADYAKYASGQLGIVIDNPDKGKTTTSSSGGGSNTSNTTNNKTSNNSGGGSSGSGGLRGVNFGPNEGADWLRTGSGLSFEEYWGVTPYGTAYYNGYTKTGQGNNSSGAGAWLNGTPMSQQKFTDLIIATGPTGNLYVSPLGVDFIGLPKTQLPKVNASTGVYNDFYTSYIFYDLYLYSEQGAMIIIAEMVRELERLYGGVCLPVPVTSANDLVTQWNKMNDMNKKEPINAAVIHAHGSSQTMAFSLQDGSANANRLFISSIENAKFQNKIVNTVLLISCNTGKTPASKEPKNIAQAFLSKNGVGRVIAAEGISQVALNASLVNNEKVYNLEIRVGARASDAGSDYQGYMLFDNHNPLGRQLKAPLTAPVSPFIERHPNKDYTSRKSEYKYQYNGLTELISLADMLK